MMIFEFLKNIFSNPLLWWLLSICIVVFNVFKTRFSPPVKVYDRLMVSALLISGALFGGDIYITLQDPLITDFYEIISAENILQGEKGSIGAVLGALIAVSVYLYIRKIPLLESADHIIPFIALAYAVGRVGCFFNGDDFGTVSSLPWAVSFEPSTEAYHAHLTRGWISSGEAESLRVHPSQLYHATAGLMGFFLLKSWRGNWQGSRFALAWVYYGATRFGIEFFRDEHEVNAAIIDPAQWFSLLFIVAGLLIWFRYRHYSRREMLVTG